MKEEFPGFTGRYYRGDSPPTKVAQASIYAYLSFMQVWEITFLPSLLVAAVAANARFEPRRLSPAQTTSASRRTVDNPKIREFPETNLNRKFFNWSAFCQDFLIPSLAILYFYRIWPGLGILTPGQNKRKHVKAMLLLSVAIISLLLWVPSVRAQEISKNNPLYEELTEQGRMTTGQITNVYGVPCVEVMLKSGESIMTFVHSTPSLKKRSLTAQDRIALINKIHYLLVINGSGNISTDKDKIFVPLDYSIEPKILPEFLSDAANHEKYILIDRRQQYLGLYEWGTLKHVFPISTGSSNSTPLKRFTVNYMDQVHNSSKFDQAPMDHALNIFNDYFIHEGIVPGYPATHGCIRVFPLHARFLFYQWAKPGIPGRIIG